MRVQTPSRRGTAQTRSIPAPVRGLNFKDSLANMKEDFAIVLENCICRPGYVEVRKGWQPYVTGFASEVESLLAYTSVTGNRELFAAAGTSIFPATTAGAVGAAVVTGLASVYFNQTQISNVAGNFLFIANGIDTERVYNGTTWANSGFTGPVAGTLSQVAVWKRRVWWVERNSTRAWYGAVDAIAGAMTSFDLSGLFRRGGRLQSIINWTVDGGDGVDDYLIFLSTMGEVVVYRGTDPSTAATFSMIGIYYIGQPVGERCWANYGGDVLFLTSEGVLPFTKFLQSPSLDRVSFLSDRIQQAISEDVTAYGATRGWELHVFFDDNFIFIQVPAGPLGSRYQWVMNTLTNAWSRFRVGVAGCWMVQGPLLWQGQATRVANGWTGGLDAADPIVGTIVPAFNYFSKAAARKRFTLARLTIESDIPPVYAAQLLVEFSQQYTFPSSTAPVPTGALWDVALWDVAVWGGSSVVYRSWYSLPGLAYAATQVIQFTSVGAVWRLVAIDYVFQTGGLL